MPTGTGCRASGWSTARNSGGNGWAVDRVTPLRPGFRSFLLVVTGTPVWTACWRRPPGLIPAIDHLRCAPPFDSRVEGATQRRGNAPWAAAPRRVAGHARQSPESVPVGGLPGLLSLRPSREPSCLPRRLVPVRDSVLLSGRRGGRAPLAACEPVNAQAPVW